MHCWPLLQAGLPPQVHAPFKHASESVGSQVTHVPPPIPQLDVD
jgi:hypothetical protein